MLRKILPLLMTGVAISACTPPTMTHQEAMAYCDDKAKSAAGPRGKVGVGVGTGGPFANVSVSISDSYIRGDDPQMVYNKCMQELSSSGRITGGTP